MLISKEQTLAMTGYTVDSALLTKAQTVIEAYVGRVEGEVNDAADLTMLGKAVAFQAVYMKENIDIVYEQMALSQMGSAGQIYSFRQGDTVSPFIAPMAVIACKSLSWRRPRSINTGRIFGAITGRDRWRTE